MTAPRLGILMLDTRFPRIPGDVGNPDSFGFPVSYSIVKGATPETIVLEDPRPFVDRFVEAGKALVSEGCTGLATTCGFLTLVRKEVEAACGVPVVSSALEQVRSVTLSLPRGQVAGVLTISAPSLSRAHLAAGDVPANTPVEGVEGSHFAESILGNHTALDVARSRDELVDGARTLCAKHPEVGAIVLECTNMPPHADAIEAATGKPVFSILTLLEDFHSSLPPAHTGNRANRVPDQNADQ